MPVEDDSGRDDCGVIRCVAPESPTGKMGRFAISVSLDGVHFYTNGGVAHFFYCPVYFIITISFTDYILYML